MIRLKGQITSGHGEARNNLCMQEAFLKKYIPNIAAYHRGTINVLLERPLIVRKVDIKTDPIPWDTRQNPVTGEIFEFVNIQFAIIAHSPHRRNPCYVEVLAPELDIRESDLCNIVIDKDMKEEGDKIIIE